MKFKTHEEIQEWIDWQIQLAKLERKDKNKPEMTSLEESNLRDRLRQAVAR